MNHDDFERLAHSQASKLISAEAREQHMAFLARLTSDAPARKPARMMAMMTRHRNGSGDARPTRTAPVSRRRRLVVGGASAVLLAAGAGSAIAFTAIHSENVANKIMLHCRAGIATTSQDVGAQSGTTSPDQTPDYGDAREVCSALWRQGILLADSSVPANIRPIVKNGIPPLTVCVDDAGAAVVVPGTQPEICGSLALAVATP